MANQLRPKPTMIEWKRLAANLQVFEAEDIFEDPEGSNSVHKILKSLTPAANAKPTLLVDGERLLAAWRTPGGVALVRFHCVVVFRYGLSSSARPDFPLGISVVSQSGLIEESGDSWVQAPLSVHDSFACGHWAVNFGDRSLECLAAKWCSYGLVEGAIDVGETLSGFENGM